MYMDVFLIENNIFLDTAGRLQPVVVLFVEVAVLLFWYLHSCCFKVRKEWGGSGDKRIIGSFVIMGNP